MWSYTLRRVLLTVPTLLIVITVCYLLLHATPGGPFDGERKVSAEVLANLQAKYHLGEPLWKQYLLYLNSLLHGDLGASFRYADWSVNDLVARALPVSLTVGGISMLLAIVLGVALGIVAALYRNSPADYLLMIIGNAGSAFPSFVIGPVLILIFAISLKWLPAGGFEDIGTVQALNGVTVRARVVHLTTVHVARDVRILGKECKSLARAGYDVTFLGCFDQDASEGGVRIRGLGSVKGRMSRMLWAPWKMYREALRQNAAIYD